MTAILRGMAEYHPDGHRPGCLRAVNAFEPGVRCDCGLAALVAEARQVLPLLGEAGHGTGA